MEIFPYLYMCVVYPQHVSGQMEASEEDKNMKQSDVNKEMMYYLYTYVLDGLENHRGAAKINGATDEQIDKAIEKMRAEFERRAF
tara:strand:- start:382 stop:636 length:255 start_codon:yes stop_codon:yes gene_type:complete